MKEKLFGSLLLAACRLKLVARGLPLVACGLQLAARNRLSLAACSSKPRTINVKIIGHPDLLSAGHTLHS